MRDAPEKQLLRSVSGMGRLLSCVRTGLVETRRRRRLVYRAILRSPSIDAILGRLSSHIYSLLVPMLVCVLS